MYQGSGDTADTRGCEEFFFSLCQKTYSYETISWLRLIQGLFVLNKRFWNRCTVLNKWWLRKRGREGWKTGGKAM